jgi:mRNA interferase MazF
MQNGEIYWANLDTPAGHRPVLLLSRNSSYNLRDFILVSPVTTRIRHISSEVNLTIEEGLPKPCVVNLDVIHTISRNRFQEKITSLSPEKLEEVERALHFVFGLSF